MKVCFFDKLYDTGAIQLSNGAFDLFHIEQNGRVTFHKGNYPHHNQMANKIRGMYAIMPEVGVWHDVLKNDSHIIRK